MTMMGSKRQVFQSEELTFEEAVDRVPFTVLLPKTLPWPEDEIEETWVRYMRPLALGYFAKLVFIYWHKGPALFVQESDTSPRIDPTVDCDFSDSDQIEKGDRVLSVVSTSGGCYATFEHSGTHVVIYSSQLEREQVAEIAPSYEPAERNR